MDNLKELELLGLTERDFELIIDGLESLPNKGGVAELMGDLLFGSLTKGSEDGNTLKQEMEKSRAEKEQKRKQLIDDTKILQSKLILFKRYMIKNNLFVKE